MVKDPATGKRVSRQNPESSWERSDVPRLAIVSPDLFDQAQEIRSGRTRLKPAFRRRPKHMLSGLLRCGSCGGGMSVKGADRGGTRVICTQFHDAKTCANQRSYYLHHLEQAVLDGLRRHLVNPSAIKLFLKTYQEERKRLAANSVNIRGRLERELAEVGRKLDRAIAAMLSSSAAVESFTSAIGNLEGEQQRLKSELSNLPEAVNVVSLHPAAQAKYLRVVDDLAAAIRDRKPASEISVAIRDLIETVTVMKTAPGEPLKIDVQGKLAALLHAPLFPAGSLSGGKLVAGEGLEPPTPGL
jgi:site-specific DNA recombinase